MTSDEYPVYAEAIREVYGRVVVPPRTGRRGRPRKPYTVIPPAVTYATVHKEKENNRVVRMRTLSTLRKVGPPWNANSPAKAFAFAPDGKQLATGHEDGSIQIWDFATGQKVRALGGHLVSYFR
jgi:WD40 repeat protein